MFVGVGVCDQCLKNGGVGWYLKCDSIGVYVLLFELDVRICIDR
tara:strand:- start:810 stop:941 length:132 start_codon:yes stop_codon:yes gene_type:complete